MYETDRQDKDLYKEVDFSVYDYAQRNTISYDSEYALEYFGNNISYKKCWEMVDKIAALLSETGVKCGDNVAVISPMLPEVVYSFYAINKIGATFFAIDPRTNAERIIEFLRITNVQVVIMLDQAYVKLLDACEKLYLKKIYVISVSDSMPFVVRTLYKAKLTQKINKFTKIITENGYRLDDFKSWENFEKISNLRQREYCEHNKLEIVKSLFYCCETLPCFVRLYDALNVIEDMQTLVKVNKDGIATLTLTSGTTGTPKMVPTKNRSYNVKVRDYSNTTMPIEVGDRILSMPPFILYGEVFMHMAFCRGVQNVLIPDITMYEYSDLIFKKKVSHAVGVPSQMLSMTENKRFKKTPPRFLKTVSVGGTRMLLEHEQRINEALKPLNIKVTQGYSMSELTPSSFTNTPGHIKEGSVGQALGDTKIWIFNSDTNLPVEARCEGEIYIASETQFDGYFENDFETQKVIILYDGMKLIRTGDRGYIDEDGYLFIKGRSKEMVIRPDGHNVFPSELEDIVTSHPDVEDCAVVGVPFPNYDAPTGEYPKAHITIKKGKIIDEAQLIEELKILCANKLPERDVPMYYEIHKEIPLTPVMKPDKMKLREMDKIKYMNK